MRRSPAYYLALGGVGDALERAWQYVRPRRLTVGDIGYEPAYESEPNEAADSIRAAFAALDDVSVR